MRTSFVLAALIATAFFAVPSTPTKAANYCLTEDTTVCGFTSFEQCMASLWGRGPGFCEVDPNDPGSLQPRTHHKHQ